MSVTQQSTPVAPHGDTDEPTMTERFLQFHRQNPRVYRTLRRLAHEWRAAGKGKCGISLLYSRCRWELSMEIEGENAFELNDHFQAYYARGLMLEPPLTGLFDLRRAPEADVWIASVRDQRDGQAA